MSDQATLFLKDKLNRVKKARKVSTIALWTTVVVSAILVDSYYRFDAASGLLIALGVATLAAFIINWYYGLKEVAVLRQIENMTRKG